MPGSVCGGGASMPPPPAPPVPAAPPLPSSPRMVNYDAMSRLEGHGMPCARPMDVFFTQTTLEDSPTIKRYREPRILAPVNRGTKRPAAPLTPRRRKSSAVFHTPTASPRAYKVKGPQGVERALEDLMHSLRVAASSPSNRLRSRSPAAPELMSRWSSSESGRDRDRDGASISGFTWFSRKSDRSHTPSSSMDSTKIQLASRSRTIKRGDGESSLKRFAASLKSKSSFSSIRSIKSGKTRRAATPGFGDDDSAPSCGPSASSSTWSFAAHLAAAGGSATDSSATTPSGMNMDVDATTSAGTATNRHLSQQLVQGFVKRLTAKRTCGPIPDAFILPPPGGRHIPQSLNAQGVPGAINNGTTCSTNVPVPMSPTLSSSTSCQTKHKGKGARTSRLGERPRPATPANNGDGGTIGRALSPNPRTRIHPRVKTKPEEASLSSTSPTSSTHSATNSTWPTPGTGSDASGGRRVHARNEAQIKPDKTTHPSPPAPNATLFNAPASTTPSAANNGPAPSTHSFGRTSARVRPGLVIPTVPAPSSCDKHETRGVHTEFIISPVQSDASNSHSHTPITPTSKRKSSLPPAVDSTPTVNSASAGESNVRKRRSILTLLGSPTSPGFHLPSSLRRRRTQIPDPIPVEHQVSGTENQVDTPTIDTMLHPSPTGSPGLSPRSHRPLSKAESILGVRFRRTGSAFSLDRDAEPEHMAPISDANEPEQSYDTTSTASTEGCDASEDEPITFSTPRRGRRAAAMTFHSVISPPGTPPASERLTTKAPSLATPDLSFESLSDLSELAPERPSTPPSVHVANGTHVVTGRAVRAAVMAAAAEPATKPRRLLHNLGQRRAGRKASRTFNNERSSSESRVFTPVAAPPLPPLPAEFGATNSTLPLGAPIAPPVAVSTLPHRTASLYAAPHAIAASHSSLNDVISRNFATTLAPPSASATPTPTPLSPRPRPPSVQVARAYAPPVPIAPDARLPPHSTGSTKRKPEWPEWPPRWDPTPDESDFTGEQVVPAPLLPSNASVHTFGTSAASYRSRASNASSVFDFSRPRADSTAESMDLEEEDEDEEWDWEERQRTVRAQAA